MSEQSEPFDWETHRAMSCKVLLDARHVTDDQAEQLKKKFADAVHDVCPGQEGAVKASIAEPGSRRWSPVGEKVPVGMDAMFDLPRP